MRARSLIEHATRWGIPGLVLLFMLATRAGFGVFRDELYYVACGRRLAFGYVDHPPMVAWLAALVGESWMALRAVSALAYAATVFVVGESAAALGGGRWERVLAQLMAATAPLYLALFSIYSMNPLDVLAWAVATRLAVGLLAAGTPRGWVTLGLVIGLGLLNKLDLALFAAGLGLGVIVMRRWELLRAWQLWAGAVLALVLFAPHVVWQAVHHWPTAEFIAGARAGKMVALGPLEFLGSQVELLGPTGLLFAVAGLIWLTFARAALRVRPLAFAALLPLVVFACSVSKPYYYGPAYTLLFPAAVMAAGTTRLPRWLLMAAVLTSLVFAPLAKPLLSADDTVAYQAALGLAPSTDEKHALGRLSQFFADMHGWRTLADSVAAASAQLSAADRAQACFFGSNYGQAAAVEFFRSELALPAAISGHNSFALWGPGECSGAVVIFMARDAADAAKLFESVEALRVHHCEDCLPMENDLTVWVGRGLHKPLPELWPELRHFD